MPLGMSRHLRVAFIACGIAFAVAVGWGGLGRAAAAADDGNALAQTQLARFYDALSGKAKLDDVLGDAFQVMRTDGTRYDRAGYLARHPTYQSYTLSGINAAQAGDVLTVSYFATVNGTIEDADRAMNGEPRLAVFTKAGGEWKLQSVANLGSGVVVNADDSGRKAVEAFVGAVVGGDVAKVRAVVAPEFQIVRADGSAYSRDAYLASTLFKFDKMPAIDDLVATGYGDTLVVRYRLEAGGMMGNGPKQPESPRLTVFRKSGNDWLVVAHANFAPLPN